MKNLHIIPNGNFSYSYIKFINDNFNMEENFFIITEDSSEEKILIPTYSNVKYKKITDQNFFLFFKEIISLYFLLLKKAKQSDNLYIHGAFNKIIIIFLFIFRGYLKKSNWIIWGGDLYCYNNRKNKFIYRIWYRIGDYVKGNFKGYITHVKGDYELAKKWYGAKGKYFNCFVYPSNLYKNILLKEYKKEEIYIQIGNSATTTNNHFEIFEKLRLYKNRNIKVFCILSYGDIIYAKEVISKGKEIFGDKFIAIVDYMKFDEYMEFLSKMDIAIFAHDRQQAVGNITSLLSMKKTVYLKENVTTYDMLKNLGIKIKSFDKFENLEKFDDKILEKNKEIVKERFSEKRLIEDLNKIFND